MALQWAEDEMSHFGVEHRPDREKPEREQRLRGPLRSNVSQHKKPFSRRSYKPGHYTPAEQIKGLVKITVCIDGAPNYQCVAVVFDIPDEFDCVLGMPFFVDVQPEIDWKRQCFKMGDSVGSSAVETSTPSGECSLTIGSELHSAVASESSRTISHDSCRAVVPETLLEGEVKVNERPADVVEKFSNREKKNAKVEAMFTLGVVDSEGVQTKYITRKKLRKFLRIPAKDQPEHDFKIALTNDTIKAIQRDVRRRDEPENVGTEKAKRFLQTDWESFKKNPAMAGAYYFSCMDLMSAYYQVRMKMNHVRYTAFKAPSGLYEYLVLPMGVSNAPATMHRLTSSSFKGIPHICSFYDDIYMFTKSKDINEHLRALRDVLEILKKNMLYVKLSKYVFCAAEIPCLGDFIGRNGVRIDPDKVQTIRDWPVPRTQEQLHSFFGLTGYVQRFCEQYAELTAPLFTLLKKKNQRNSKISTAAKLQGVETPVVGHPSSTLT
ncbi:unnamed protein product [Phytophthora fragariaefolia]|uniref:Unnamed protein product n=1 Tax=Phytophthora fragariaefolia TaxID=1490495 RepID=A0A9W6YIA8_9STRA|nr:unnamed protein product [Phytophthora fragariaefolia]